MTNVPAPVLYGPGQWEDNRGDMCHAARHHHHHFEGSSRRATREERQQEFVHKATRVGAAFMICVAVWVFTGLGSFWPIWVIGIGGLILARDARDAYGSGSDDDYLESAEDREPISTL